MGSEHSLFHLPILFNMKTNKFLYIIAIMMLVLAACQKESIVRQRTKPQLVLGVADSLRLKNSLLKFSRDTVYVLATNLNIGADQNWQIEAGTLVKVNKSISIIINIGARVEAKGTVTDPIIFTSSAEKGNAGNVNGTVNNWNGITINGSTSMAVFNFVRIEFAGAQQAAFLINGTGNETSINHVQVSYSNNGSFEFRGGSINAANLVSYGAFGTDFNLTNGYRGMLQNLLAYRLPYFITTAGSVAGLLVQGNNTFPVISNLTVIGPDKQLNTERGYYDSVTSVGNRRVAAFLVTANSKFHVANSVLMGFPATGFHMDNRASAISLQNGESSFTYSLVQCSDSNRAFYLSKNIYPPFTSVDFKDFALRPSFNNQLLYNFEAFQLTDPFNYDLAPDPLPKANSPVLLPSNYDSTAFRNPFFKKLNYRGALGTDNWLKSWTNFIPLQTNYNN
jgi:hypothetical protein